MIWDQVALERVRRTVVTNIADSDARLRMLPPRSSFDTAQLSHGKPETLDRVWKSKCLR